MFVNFTVVSIDAILRDEALGTMKTVLIAIQRIPLGPGKTVIGELKQSPSS